MKRTDKTLVEQLQISDIEIMRRLELLGLNHESLNELSRLKPFIEDNIEHIVEEFYDKQTEIDEISLLIGDADTLRRLRNAQRRYVIDLFSGHYDAEYVNNRLRIGMVHKRIGVEPKLYLSAVRTLKEVVNKTIFKKKESEQLGTVLETLDKLFYFDTTLVFDTYIDSLVGEIETAKKRTELYATSLEQKVAERTHQLEKMAKIDPLTNIYNRRAMQELLRRELASAKRREKQISILYLDVDHFKKINDTEGHIKGDEVLSYVGSAIKNSIREIDVACRYGGDEFCVILPDCSLENAKKIAEKLVKAFVTQFPDFSLSIGVSETGPSEFMTADELVKSADQQMYSSKKHSGNFISC